MCSLKGQNIDSISRWAFSPVTGMERKNKLLGSKSTSSLQGSYFSFPLPPKVMVKIFTTFLGVGGAIRFLDYRDDAILKNWWSDTMGILGCVLAQIES